MAENSKIEWTDHTFNPWVGCIKVSEGCVNCYAEGWAKRSGLVEWGPKGERRRTSPANWRKPYKWDRDSASSCVKVFCASLADVFENHPSIDPQWRADLWTLISSTPHLLWLLLTKRPENIVRFLPEGWMMGYPNVWLGTTVENQEQAEARIPHLLATPAARRFVSCEPLLGPLTLPLLHPPHARLDWVIVGGESGPKARPMHPDWARSLRDQCADAGVPFLFKQWGEWLPGTQYTAALVVKDQEPDSRYRH
ncbi:MAG: phage Gp37/Gp68 family protein, partial [Rhodospirillales bacterium]|nr:phage Gp37/Gp68 family protein [Rhodospirillales bacterium]